jgi:hypothetical protein
MLDASSASLSRFCMHWRRLGVDQHARMSKYMNILFKCVSSVLVNFLLKWQTKGGHAMLLRRLSILQWSKAFIDIQITPITPKNPYLAGNQCLAECPESLLSASGTSFQHFVLSHRHYTIRLQFAHCRYLADRLIITRFQFGRCAHVVPRNERGYAAAVVFLVGAWSQWCFPQESSRS